MPRESGFEFMILTTMLDSSLHIKVEINELEKKVGQIKPKTGVVKYVRQIQIFSKNVIENEKSNILHNVIRRDETYT